MSSKSFPTLYHHPPSSPSIHSWRKWKGHKRRGKRCWYWGGEKEREKKKVIANSPTSTVTWTLIFPLSLEAENISVEISLPIFCCPALMPLLPAATCPLLLCFAKLLLAEILPFVSSIWYESLSLPSGDLRTVVSYDAVDDVIDAIAVDDVDEWFVMLLYWCELLLALFDDVFDDIVLIAGIAFE